MSEYFYDEDPIYDKLKFLDKKMVWNTMNGLFDKNVYPVNVTFRDPVTHQEFMFMFKDNNPNNNIIKRYKVPTSNTSKKTPETPKKKTNMNSTDEFDHFQRLIYEVDLPKYEVEKKKILNKSKKNSYQILNKLY
jgi:hypothetical protein